MIAHNKVLNIINTNISFIVPPPPPQCLFQDIVISSRNSQFLKGKKYF